MANIYTFSPFGYEGALVTVEVDLRRGIPAVDIVGLADGAVKETRERVRAAINNSGFEFPSERVLISLSPADLKKEGAGFDLPIALGIMNEAIPDFVKEKVLVLGELELSGKVRAVKGVHAAISSAMGAGIRYVIVPKANLLEASSFTGLKVSGVDSLEEAVEVLKDISLFGNVKEQKDSISDAIQFSDCKELEENLSDMKLPKRLVRAIEVAIAGKHHLLITGQPGCGKTMVVQNLVPYLTPKLTFEESQSVTRIWSLAGLMKPTDGSIRTVPFRLPHQTASIEGICGGGIGCRPGEISLAHNGVLFLDESAEFRSSVLQMLRVPLENHTITLSRAGRSTTYPANFQLIMATNPCPCGNYGSKDRICLCSAKSVEMYWHKFSAPLIDCVGIILQMDSEEEKQLIDVKKMRKHVATAFEIQRKKGVYNNNLNPWELSERAQLDKEAVSIFDSWIIKHDVGQRRESNILKVALTIANIDGREIISKDDVLEAISYSKTFSLATN